MNVEQALKLEEDSDVSLDQLRTVCCEGQLKHHAPWTRSLTYKLLLGYLPINQRQWIPTLRQRRAEYFQFLIELSEERTAPNHTTSLSDKILGRIYNDIYRAADVDPDFYDAMTTWTYHDAMNTRHQLLSRLERVDNDFALRALRDRPTHARFIDRQWHAILRILFLFARLNPSMGYVQGMNEVLYVLLRVLVATRDTNIADDTEMQREVGAMGSTADMEADAFWCFSLLCGCLREVYDFGQGDQTMVGAMNYLLQHSNTLSSETDNKVTDALHQISRQLQRVDPPLYEALAPYQLDPSLPFYSLRWMVCLFACEFHWLDVLNFWDVLLAQFLPDHPEIASLDRPLEFLADVGCAILVDARHSLLEIVQTSSDVFNEVTQLLGPHSRHDAQHIHTLATKWFMERHSSLSSTTQYPAKSQISPASNQRRLRLQQRLAATVQQTTQTPPKRSSTWTPGIPSQRASAIQSPLNLGDTNVASNLGDGSAHARYTSNQSNDTDSYSSEQTNQVVNSEPGNPLASSVAQLSRSILRRYTDALQGSNAAASVSKARTNLAARAIGWRSASNSSEVAGMTSPTTSQRYPTSDNKREAPDLPIPSVTDDAEGHDAQHSMSSIYLNEDFNSMTPVSISSGKRAQVASPSAIEDDSFGTSWGNGKSVVLPSMRKAAEMGLLGTPPNSGSPFLASVSSSETSPNQRAGLTRRLASTPRSLSRRSAEQRPSSARVDLQSSNEEARPVPSIESMAAFQHLPAVLPTPVVARSSEQLTQGSPPAGSSAHLDALLQELQTENWMKKQ
ncbi:hypothetical protein MYAM1_001425 [Malassezia yamatoensis]|uniref:Rab-GAP TBC domain-containing protein n=1 Tax=Malassezia yamatoensis TaxID=253288 RepID=A0AAJ5YT32_9BASI|nr:hypothetical protein MYAM1_001425 [Malassezia yamatoensis]